MTNEAFLVSVLIPFIGALLGGVVAANINAKSDKKIAASKLTHEMRMAALEKRLQVHQEAYTHWLRIFRAMHSPQELQQLLPEAFKWWDENCLYLHPGVSHKLRVAFLTAATFDTMRKASSNNPDLIIKEHETVQEVGPLIQTSVGLPEINPTELAKPTKA